MASCLTSDIFGTGNTDNSDGWSRQCHTPSSRDKRMCELWPPTGEKMLGMRNKRCHRSACDQGRHLHRQHMAAGQVHFPCCFSLLLKVPKICLKHPSSGHGPTSSPTLGHGGCTTVTRTTKMWATKWTSSQIQIQSLCHDVAALLVAVVGTRLHMRSWACKACLPGHNRVHKP